MWLTAQATDLEAFLLYWIMFYRWCVKILDVRQNAHGHAYSFNVFVLHSDMLFWYISYAELRGLSIWRSNNYSTDEVRINVSWQKFTWIQWDHEIEYMQHNKSEFFNHFREFVAKEVAMYNSVNNLETIVEANLATEVSFYIWQLFENSTSAFLYLKILIKGSYRNPETAFPTTNKCTVSP